MKQYNGNETPLLSAYLLDKYGYSLRDFKISHTPDEIEKGLWYYSGKDFTLIIKDDVITLLDNGESEVEIYNDMVVDLDEMLVKFN
jgi:hypothetical protein